MHGVEGFGCAVLSVPWYSEDLEEAKGGPEASILATLNAKRMRRKFKKSNLGKSVYFSF